MTEFGSDRYLEKLHQSQAASAAQPTPTPVLSQSQFILPLRGSSLSEADAAPPKTVDQKRPDKKTFAFLRGKFHPKSSAAGSASSVETPESRPLSTHSTAAARRR
jgi:hypothetical protein